MYSYWLRSFKHFLQHNFFPSCRNLKEEYKEIKIWIIFYSITRDNNVLWLIFWLCSLKDCFQCIRGVSSVNVGSCCKAGFMTCACTLANVHSLLIFGDCLLVQHTQLPQLTEPIPHHWVLKCFLALKNYFKKHHMNIVVLTSLKTCVV